jgi:hypothetical protein
MKKKYLLILLIGLFAVSLFLPLTFVNAQEPTPTPSDSPTPTATPTDITVSLNSLTFGENVVSYLILLVFLILVMYIGLKNKYGAIVAVPFGMIVSIFYLVNGCGWHFILLLFVSMGIMDLAASGKIKQ